MKIVKDKDTMCGVACVEWICENEKVLISINKSEVWCCSLASILQQSGFKTKVKCYNSRLYQDFKNLPNEQFEGFKTIRNYLKNNQIVVEEPTISNIKKEIENNKYVIFNVSSKIFHKDNSMNGGHYIVATSFGKNMIEIVNPRETDFEIRKISVNDLISCIKDFGAWRILIN